MNTLFKTATAFIYVILGLFEPAVLDQGSTDERISVSAKIVKSISAVVFVLSLVWGLIAMSNIINYLEVVQFISIFFTVGFCISLFVVYLITIPIPELKGNKDFLFYTLFSCVVSAPLSVDYLNRNIIELETSTITYEIVDKSTKSNEAMFSWIYLSNPTNEIKVNVSKQVFNSLRTKDKVEVSIEKGLFGFEFIRLSSAMPRA